MRIARLALVAGVLICASPSAQALTVNKSVEVAGAPQKVWAEIGDFCAIQKWHPNVVSCVVTKDGEILVRTVTLKSKASFKEKLTNQDDLGYTYEAVETQLPVESLKSKFWAEAGANPDSTLISWEMDFEPKGNASPDQLTKLFDAVISEGFKGIQDKMGASQ